MHVQTKVRKLPQCTAIDNNIDLGDDYNVIPEWNNFKVLADIQ